MESGEAGPSCNNHLKHLIISENKITVLKIHTCTTQRGLPWIGLMMDNDITLAYFLL